MVACLLQFADETCLICSADSPTKVTAMLQDDINALSQWITMSKMKLNLKKSSIMWFSIRPFTTVAPPAMVDDIALSLDSKQKYL